MEESTMRYGARSTYRRKGYWLTALAAAGLLAASSGTALAQVTITGPDKDTVAEGGTAEYKVEVKGFIQPDAEAGAITVTLTGPVVDNTTAATTGELADISTNTIDPDVTISVPANDATRAVRFSRTAAIRVQTTDDADAEDEKFTVSFGAVIPETLTMTSAADSAAITLVTTGDDAAPTKLTIADDEDQEYKLTYDGDDPKEGVDETFTVTLTAEPAHEDGSEILTMQVDVSRTIASVESAPVTLSSANNSRPIVVTVGGNDKNRVEDTIMLTAYSGTAGNSTPVDTLSIDIEDKNELPAVAMMVVDEDDEPLDPQPTSVKEGDSIMVVVMVVDDKGKAEDAGEDLEVALNPTGMADSADYEVVRTIDITAGEDMSAAVELEVKTDEDVGMESLMFDAVVSGESTNGPGTRTSAGVLSFYIEDDTTKKIEPKATEADYDRIKAAIAEAAGEEGLNPGESFTLMTKDLFTVTDGYRASYSVSVEGTAVSASATGEMVTINAEMAGESKVTVSGTARMPGSSLMPSQTVSNDASLTFPVMVEDTTLVVTLSADPMEIEAGGTTMITATANRAVTAGDGAVAIALAVVPSDGGTLDPESIMIAMGAMSGSATLTANESVAVVASGSGVTGLMQVAVTVTAAPEPVPALPLIGQLLLGLGLLGGGARHLYRRRRQG